MPKPTCRPTSWLVLPLTLVLLSGCATNKDTNTPANSTSQTNTQRTGVYNAKGLHSSPSVAWKFKAEAEIAYSPAVAGGMVYFGSDDKRLYALDSATGQMRWQVETGGFVRSSPIIEDGVVYAGSDDGALYAVNATTGVERWKSKTYGYFILLDKQGICCEDYLETNLPAPGVHAYGSRRILDGYSSTYSKFAIRASPIITGSRVYFGDESAYFYAADLATGEIAWAEATITGVTSTPAAEGNSVYYVGGSGILISKDAKTGRENWRFYTSADIPNGSIVMADGVIYLSGFEFRTDNSVGSLWAVDATSGKEKWRFDREGHVTSPAISVGQIYLSIGRHLYAVDAKTGKELWAADIDPSTTPSIADGLVYVGTRDGYLYALDADTGREQWKFKTESRITNAPAIADGMVFFGSEDGYLYALR